MASYLLIISDRKALGWILTAGRMAFPSRNRPEVRDLHVDDELFIYTTRGAFNKASDGGRIIGTARVASEVRWFPEAIRIAGRKYPRGCDLEIGPLAPFGQGVELSPLIPQLNAFHGAGPAWSMRLRKPLLHLGKDDASILHRVLNTVRAKDELQPNAMAGYTRWFVEDQASAPIVQRPIP
jgi:hypothetical protein